MATSYKVGINIVARSNIENAIRQAEQLRDALRGVQNVASIIRLPRVTIDSRNIADVREFTNTLRNLNNQINRLNTSAQSLSNVRLNLPADFATNTRRLRTSLNALQRSLAGIDANRFDALGRSLTSFSRAVSRLTSIGSKTLRFRIIVDTNITDELNVRLSTFASSMSTLSKKANATMGGSAGGFMSMFTSLANKIKSLFNTRAAKFKSTTGNVPQTEESAPKGTTKQSKWLTKKSSGNEPPMTEIAEYATALYGMLKKTFNITKSILTLPLNLLGKFYSALGQLDKFVRQVAQGLYYVSGMFRLLGYTLSMVGSLMISTINKLTKWLLSGTQIEYTSRLASTMFLEVGKANDALALANESFNIISKAASEAGISLQMAADALYTIGSAGVDNLQVAQQYLNTVSKVAYATGSAPNEVFKSLLNVVNAFDMPITDLGYVINSITIAAAKGVFDMQDFVSILNQVSTFAELSNTSLTEMLGTLVGISQTGISTGQLASSYSQFMMDLVKKEPALAQAGITTRYWTGKTMEMYSPVEIIKQVKELYPTKQAQASLIQSLGLQKKSLSFFERLINSMDKVEQGIDTIKKAQSSNYMDEVFKDMMDTVDYSYNVLLQQLDTLKVKFLEIYKRDLKQLLDNLSMVVSKFIDWLSNGQNAALLKQLVVQIVKISLLITMIGVILIGLSLVVRTISGVIEMLRPNILFLAGIIIGILKGIYGNNKAVLPAGEGKTITVDLNDFSADKMLSAAGINQETLFGQLASAYFNTVLGTAEGLSFKVTSALFADETLKMILVDKEVPITLKILNLGTEIVAQIAQGVADFLTELAKYVSQPMDELQTNEQKAFKNIIENIGSIFKSTFQIIGSAIEIAISGVKWIVKDNITINDIAAGALLISGIASAKPMVAIASTILALTLMSGQVKQGAGFKFDADTLDIALATLTVALGLNSKSTTVKVTSAALALTLLSATVDKGEGLEKSITDQLITLFTSLGFGMMIGGTGLMGLTLGLTLDIAVNTFKLGSALWDLFKMQKEAAEVSYKPIADKAFQLTKKTISGSSVIPKGVDEYSKSLISYSGYNLLKGTSIFDTLTKKMGGESKVYEFLTQTNRPTVDFQTWLTAIAGQAGIKQLNQIPEKDYAILTSIYLIMKAGLGSDGKLVKSAEATNASFEKGINSILDFEKNVSSSIKEAIKSGIGIATSQISTMLENFTTSTINVTEKTVQTVLDDLVNNAKGVVKAYGGYVFASGGATGSGTTYDVAGVVHKGEYVIPQWMVRKYPEVVGGIESMRLKGFAQGGYADGGVVGFVKYLAKNGVDRTLDNYYKQFKNEQFNKWKISENDYWGVQSTFKNFVSGSVDTLYGLTKTVVMAVPAVKQAQGIIENEYARILTYGLASMYEAGDDEAKRSKIQSSLIDTLIATTLYNLFSSAFDFTDKEMEATIKSGAFGFFDIPALYYYTVKRDAGKTLTDWSKRRKNAEMSMLFGFAGGGYTGGGSTFDVAGVVHKGEYVIPQWMVRKYPDTIKSLDSVRTRGFQAGGSTSTNIISTGADALGEILGTLSNVIGSLGDLLGKLLESLVSAKGTIDDLVPSLKDLAKGIQDSFNKANSVSLTPGITEGKSEEAKAQPWDWNAILAQITGGNTSPLLEGIKKSVELIQKDAGKLANKEAQGTGETVIGAIGAALNLDIIKSLPTELEKISNLKSVEDLSNYLQNTNNNIAGLVRTSAGQLGTMIANAIGRLNITGMPDLGLTKVADTLINSVDATIKGFQKTVDVNTRRAGYEAKNKEYLAALAEFEKYQKANPTDTTSEQYMTLKNTAFEKEGARNVSGAALASAEVLNSVLTTTMPIFDALVASVAGAITPLMGMIGGMRQFQQILQPAQVIAEAMFAILQPFITELLNPLVGILQILGQTLGAVLIPLLQMLMPIINLIGAAFVFVYNSLLRPVITALYTAFGMLRNALLNLFNTVSAVVAKLTLGMINLGQIEVPNLTEEIQNLFPEINLESLAYAGASASGSTGSTSGTGATSGTGVTSQAQNVSYTITNNFNISDSIIADKEQLKQLLTDIMYELNLAGGG